MNLYFTERTTGRVSGSRGMQHSNRVCGNTSAEKKTEASWDSAAIASAADIASRKASLIVAELLT
jgi:hypothetical protein